MITPSDYTIKLTQRSNWRVCNWAGRELGQYQTKDKAKEIVAAEVERHALESAQAEAAHLYNASVPDLNRLQLEWQEARSRLYDYICWFAKKNDAEQRHLDQIPEGQMGEFGTTGSPSYSRTESRIADDSRFLMEARWLYDEACTLDSRIKTARRTCNTQALAEALAETPAMIQRMRRFSY